MNETPSDAPSIAAAHEALAALPRAQREEILSLPAREATTIIRLLVAFPGSHFVANEKGPRHRHDPSQAEISF